jgi:hypothetical protein
MASLPVRLMEGLRWKFSFYQIRDGYIIPSPMATLEWYDPWDNYQRGKQQKGNQPPYQSLFALLESFERSRPLRAHNWMDSPKELPQDGPQRILDWCSKFGLLGLLPHNLRRIQQTPRFVAGNERWVYRPEYERVGRHWQSCANWYPADPQADRRELCKQSPLPDPTEPGRQIPTDHPGYNSGGPAYDPPHVYLNDPLTERHSQETRVPLTSLPPVFFPECRGGDPSRFDCPIPGTPEFARSYAEPLDCFVREAVYLWSSGTSLLSNDPTPPPNIEIFEKYLQPLTLGIERDPVRKLRECWFSPSLLCSFARMIVQDASEGLDLRHCDCCRAPYLTDRYQSRYCSRYCSQACGWKHRKRRARASSADSMEASNGEETRKQ